MHRKPIQDFIDSAKICHCGQKVLYLSFPNGADYTTCPICRKYGYNVKGLNLNNSDDISENYCTLCKIVFDFSHDHCTRGCYNFPYAEILCDGTDVVIFNDIKEAYDNLNNPSFKLLCTCRNMRVCTTGYKITEEICNKTF